MSQESVKPCLMVAVDLNTSAPDLIRRAARLASTADLHLLVVHLVEYHSGFESDHIPFISPAQMRSEMANSARDGLVRLLQSLGLPEAEVLVTAGRLNPGLAELVLEYQAHYLITGPLRWGFLSRLSRLGKDWRVLEAGCEVLHLGKNEHWTETSGRLSQLFGA
jgi:hypothetical protein